MNLEKLNLWLTLGANFGVLIGIIVVAVELNQTQTALQMDASTTRTEKVIQRSNIYRDNDIPNIIQKLESGLELTPAEESNSLEWLTYTLRDWENLHYQYQQGVLDEEIWSSNYRGIQRMCRGVLFPRFFDWPDGPESPAYRRSFVELVVSSCK